MNNVMKPKWVSQDECKRDLGFDTDIYDEKVDEVCRMLFDLDEDYINSDSITVGGYILENAGSIPNKRESVEAGGFRFTIMEVANQRIIRVVVKRLVDESTNEEKATDEKEKEE